MDCSSSDSDDSINSSDLMEAQQGLEALRELFSGADGDSLPGEVDGSAAGGANLTPGRDDADGVEFLARFEVLQTLGHGGFSTVLLARDRKLNRRVAVKVYNGSIVASERLQRRFLVEAQTMAELKHPAIVPIYDAGTEGALWYLVMEYCAGPTLAAWIAEARPSPVPPRLAAAIVARLAEAVHYAHSRGRLHRDIKPSNVLLEPDPYSPRADFPFAIKLSDFGLTRSVDATADANSNQVISGTPGYMAPEQAAGRECDVTVRSDVYGLGVVLYEFMTGVRPFATVVADDAPDPVPNSEPVPVRKMRLDAPLDLAAICQRCLQTDPQKRYETAHELQQDLARFVEGRPVTARPVGSFVATVRWCRRRPLVAGLIAGLLVALLGGGSAVVWQWRRAEANLVVATTQTSLAKDHLDRSQSMLVLLGWALDESFFWNDSHYQFDANFRESLAKEFKPLIDHGQEFPATQAVLATAHRRLAHELTEGGHRKAGDDHHRKSLVLWRELLWAEPENPRLRRSLALTLYYWAQYRTQETGAQHPVDDLLNGNLISDFSLHNAVDRNLAEDFADLLVRRGHALRAINSSAAAVGTLHAAMELVQRLRGAWPEEISYTARSGDIFQAMGRCYEDLGRLAVAEVNYVEACRCYERLSASHGNADKYEDQLAKVYESRGRLRLHKGDLAGSSQLLEAAMRIYLKQADADPKALDKRRLAADRAWDAATAGHKGWSSVDQLTTWRRCKHLHEYLGPSAAADPTLVKRLAFANGRQADAELALDQRDAALVSLAQSVEFYAALSAREPGKGDLLNYADTLQKLASLQETTGDAAGAKATYAKLVKTYETLEASENDYLVIADRLKESREKLSAL